MIQLSIEIPDRPGELSRVVGLLADLRIDVKALYVSCDGPTAGMGHVRMIVTDPKAAMSALQDHGLSLREEKVVVIAVEDQPGGLAAALSALTAAQINLTYAYGFVSRIEGRALSVFGVEDSARASQTLCEAGFKLVEHSTDSEPDLSAYVGGAWNW